MKGQRLKSVKNTLDLAVERVLMQEPEGDDIYPRISNEELLGIRPRNSLEASGTDLRAKSLRDRVNPILEKEYGIGLIPDDYSGTWKVVDVNERAAHVIEKRLKKVVRLLVEGANGESSILSQTIENYKTNEYINEEMDSLLRKASRAITAIEVVAEEALLPKLERIRALTFQQMASNDKQEK